MRFLDNWVRNAVATQLRGVVQAEIEAARERDTRLVRELVQEMDDVLEKFTRVVAREAMRRSRDTKKAMEDTGNGSQLPAPPVDRKQALRAALMGGGRGLIMPLRTDAGHNENSGRGTNEPPG